MVEIGERGRRCRRSFLGRPALTVARALLGCTLVRQERDRRISGVIVETEAYCDGEQRDLACHGDRANGGAPTRRTRVMFGPPGCAYVYFTYGMHWMFNVVTGRSGEPNAVLIRALQPVEGVELMLENRAGRARDLTNGPARLARALAIDGGMNGLDLCHAQAPIWIERQPPLAAGSISTGPRIGLGKTPEPWLSAPWRFWIEQNEWVSR